jgi:hypothetical protein
MFVVVPASMAFPLSPGFVAMPHPSCTLAGIVVQHETRRKTTEQNTHIRQTLFCTLLIPCRQTMVMETLQMVGVMVGDGAWLRISPPRERAFLRSRLAP